MPANMYKIEIHFYFTVLTQFLFILFYFILILLNTYNNNNNNNLIKNTCGCRIVTMAGLSLYF